MKENQRKSHVSGDEAVQTKGDALIQSHPTASTGVEIRSSSLIREEENTIQDTQYGKLPSHRGNKKPKLGSFTLSKSFVVELNPSVPPAASIQPSMAPKANTPLPNASPSLNPITATLPESRPLTLLRSEGLAWERF